MKQVITCNVSLKLLRYMVIDVELLLFIVSFFFGSRTEQTHQSLII